MKFNKEINSSKPIKKIIYGNFGKWLSAFFIVWFVSSVLVQEFYFKKAIHAYIIEILTQGFMFFAILILIYFILMNLIEEYLSKEFERLQLEMKNVNSNDLTQRLNYGEIEEFNQFTNFTNQLLEKLERTMIIEKKHALVDPLTNCYNRRALTRDFGGFKEKALRENKSISLLIIDIDNFKKINDTYGHSKGDDVLIALGKILRNVVRRYDIVYRIGGEEFLVVFYDLDSKFKKEILTRLNKFVSYQLKKLVGGIDSEMSFSGGFITSKSSNLKNKELLNEMLKEADRFLYDAKKAGKNKIIC